MLEQAFCAKRTVSKLETWAMRWRMVAASYTHSGVPNWSARDHSWAGENGLDMGGGSKGFCTDEARIMLPPMYSVECLYCHHLFNMDMLCSMPEAPTPLAHKIT